MWFLIGSTTAQFNLGKLLLRRRRKKPAGRGLVNVQDGVDAQDGAEGKGLLQRVIRDNDDHSGAKLCLAHALAEEGGAGRFPLTDGVHDCIPSPRSSLPEYAPPPVFKAKMKNLVVPLGETEFREEKRDLPPLS